MQFNPKTPDDFRVSDSQEAIDADVVAVSRLDAVPTLLDVLCESTGLGFVAVARVTDGTWTACAVKDNINFGLKPGEQLDVDSTLCIEVKRSNSPVAINHASHDSRYKDHRTTKQYRIESYVSVPIVLENGRYFGNLCAIDQRPAQVIDAKTLSMFRRFADLIAIQLAHELRHERNEAALVADQANDVLRDQFIAILGHDLRNPLQAVFATSELIVRKSTEPNIVRLGERVTLSAKRMGKLIDDVLDFARGNFNGGIGVKLADVDDVNSALNFIVGELRDGHAGRRIEATIGVTGTVRCDMARVQQVASNLIGNALTHGEATTPVKVCAYLCDDNMVLEVWNTGVPIPAESLSKVFQPFWRRSGQGNSQGLGLGLHICSQIVRAHNGSLSVESSAAQGTTFTARFPVRAA